MISGATPTKVRSGFPADRNLRHASPIGRRLGAVAAALTAWRAGARRNRHAGDPVLLHDDIAQQRQLAALTVNLPDLLKVGTVGRPLPGTSVRVAEDGELLFSGGQVFAGYWNDEAATGEALERDGWFHTGDVGEVDDEGFVRITGRKKEIIVTAGGKNVAPAVLEDRLRAHALIDQCMVVGDGQPFIAALVTLDPDAVSAWAQAHGKSGKTTDLVDDPKLQAEIEAAVEDANKAVSKAEAIRKFRILPDEWTEEGGQLTPSLKLKRNVVMREAKDDIAALYMA